MYLSSFAWSTGKECLLFVAPFKGQFNGLILLSYPWMYVFLEAVSQRLGQRPIIYCYNLSDNLLYCWKWPQKPRKYLMLAHRIKPETSRNTPPQWQSLPNVFITVTRFFTSKCFFVNFRGAKKNQNDGGRIADVQELRGEPWHRWDPLEVQWPRMTPRNSGHPKASLKGRAWECAGISAKKTHSPLFSRSSTAWFVRRRWAPLKLWSCAQRGRITKRMFSTRSTVRGFRTTG